MARASEFRTAIATDNDEMLTDDAVPAAGVTGHVDVDRAPMAGAHAALRMRSSLIFSADH